LGDSPKKKRNISANVRISEVPTVGRDLGERAASERTGYPLLNSPTPHELCKKRMGWRTSQSATSRYTSQQASETGWRRVVDSPHRPLFMSFRLSRRQSECWITFVLRCVDT